jgi:hypothetical protein
MINFLKTCLFTFTIWMLAALINALLYAIIFNLGNIVHDDFHESFGMAFFFSLIFSAPGVFCLWIVFMINSGNPGLSKKVLRAVFILSLISCVFILVLPNDVYKGHWFLLSFIIIFSSLASVMLHHCFLHSFQSSSHV